MIYILVVSLFLSALLFVSVLDFKDRDIYIISFLSILSVLMNLYFLYFILRLSKLKKIAQIGFKNPVYSLRFPKELFSYLNRLLDENSKIKLCNANITHELKTPLSTLQIEMESLLIKSNRLKISSFENLTSALDTINYANTIIEQLNVLYGYSKKSVPMERVFIDEILEHALSEKSHQIEKKSLNVIERIENIIPVHGNRTLLNIAFSNFLDNALKYTPKSGTVKIALKRRKNHFTIFFADNGIGILKKDLPYIFDPLFTGSNESIKGNGIGLAIANYILNMHGAKVKIRSVHKSYTVFVIKFDY